MDVFEVEPVPGVLDLFKLPILWGLPYWRWSKGSLGNNG